MNQIDLSQLKWRKSSHSGGGNDCVEIAFTDDGTVIRDSKNPDGGVLLLHTTVWQHVLTAARDGHLNP